MSGERLGAPNPCEVVATFEALAFAFPTRLRPRRRLNNSSRSAAKASPADGCSNVEVRCASRSRSRANAAHCKIGRVHADWVLHDKVACDMLEAWWQMCPIGSESPTRVERDCAHSEPAGRAHDQGRQNVGTKRKAKRGRTDPQSRPGECHLHVRSGGSGVAPSPALSAGAGPMDWHPAIPCARAGLAAACEAPGTAALGARRSANPNRVLVDT